MENNSKFGLGINPSALDILHRPTSKENIKWKVQTSQKDGKYQMFVCYVDKRDAIERLDEAFGLAWSATYQDVEVTADGKRIPGIQCTIIVKNEVGIEITRRSAAAEASKIEPVKSSRSNALKLAAGMFGFSKHLYGFPKVLVEAEKKGNFTNIKCPGNKLQKAFELVWDIHIEGAVEYDFLWIDAKGDVYTVTQFKGKGTLIKKQSAVNTTPPKTTKPKTTTKPKAETKTSKEKTIEESKKIVEDAMAKSKAPQMLNFPTKSAAKDGGKNWVLALQCWTGTIHKAKTGDYHFVTLTGYTKKGEKSYHKLDEKQLVELRKNALYITG